MPIRKSCRLAGALRFAVLDAALPVNPEADTIVFAVNGTITLNYDIVRDSSGNQCRRPRPVFAYASESSRFRISDFGCTPMPLCFNSPSLK